MRFEPKPITAEEVRAFRDAEGASWSDAKKTLKFRREEEAFSALMAEGTAEEKLDWLLRRYAQNRGFSATE